MKWYKKIANSILVVSVGVSLTVTYGIRAEEVNHELGSEKNITVQTNENEITKSEVTQLEKTETKETEPQKTETEETESEKTETKETEPEKTETEETEPEKTETEETEPEKTETKETEPEKTETEETEPEKTETKETESEKTETEETEPEKTETEETEPEETETKETEPEKTETEETKPEKIETEETKSENKQPEKPQAEDKQPEKTSQEITKPEVVIPKEEIIPIIEGQTQKNEMVPKENTIQSSTSEIDLDGKFDDWQDAERIEFNQNNIKSISTRWIGDYVYLYVEEEDRVGNEFSFTWGTFLEWSSNYGTSQPFRAFLGAGDENRRELEIQGFKGAQGVGSKNGNKYIWELKFPVSELGSEIYDISLGKYNEAIPLVGITDETGNHVQRVEPVEPELSAGSISTDGYFSEWDNITHQDITYKSFDGTQMHSGALYKDGTKLYGHLKMHDSYPSQMQIGPAMTLTINGEKTIQFVTDYADADGNITYNSKIYNMDVGVNGGLAIFDNNAGSDGLKAYLGEAAFTVYDSEHKKGDEYEFAISLEQLSKITGIPVESMKQFELYAPNVGEERVVWQGTSTGPEMYLLVCIASIGIGSTYCSKRKKVSV